MRQLNGYQNKSVNVLQIFHGERDIAGMRDRLIHQYIDVDLMIVWLVITENATPLLISIEAIIETLENE
ncbi:hypothetical protein GCM10027085_20910 [Spirosoma aerophilum]